MFKEKLELVPNSPGSYQMYNSDSQIIYIGKAKDLKKRLSSYFNRTQNNKTAMLVKEIANFEYIVTSTEVEAFILELNLIKKHNPKYNILLTDDKSYPYIEYIKKPYPQLKISRYLKVKKKRDSILFGPYPNSYAARRVVNLVNRIYPLKKCKVLPKEPCLYYHIGECLGYCFKKIDEELIDNMEKDVISFLNGTSDHIKKILKEKIEFHSNNLNYEQAATLKEELNYMSIILDKQSVELSDLINRDVINYYNDDFYCSIIIFFIRNGKLLEIHRNIFPIINDLKENIEQYIMQYYENHEIPNEILITDDINKDIISNILNTKVLTPYKGEKKKLLNLVEENAKINLETNLNLIKNKENKTEKANEELKSLLNLRTLNRIDVFDNSNLFGNFSVSGMIVFRNGNPSKKEYRKYKIKLDKNNDYEMMKEVIYRRYYKMLMEKSEYPNLIIVDGGEIQIGAAKSVLNELQLDIKVCGLSKDDNHNTNSLIDGDTLKSYSIDKSSDLFNYLTRIQNEIHRYTINYHRNIRNKGSFASILDNVEGIGPKRKKELLIKFGSLKNMKSAKIEDLNKILPLNVATKLIEELSKLNL